MYWKDRLGSVPQPSVAPNAANYTDMVSDNENNYVDYERAGAPSSVTNVPVPTGPLDTLATPLATDEPSFVTGPVAVSTSSAAPSSSSAGASPTDLPPPQCNGLSSNKYIAEADLAGNIQDYCSQAAAQGKQDPNSGSLGRTFNKGTPEQIDITMTWPPGQPLPKCNDPFNLILNGKATHPIHQCRSIS